MFSLRQLIKNYDETGLLTAESSQIPGYALKRFLLIFSDRIFDSSVDLSPVLPPHLTVRILVLWILAELLRLVLFLELPPSQRDKVGSPLSALRFPLPHLIFALAAG